MSETVNQPAAREGTGCPVLHQDFSQPMPACGYLRLANELRERSPVFFNQFKQGYWVFTRHDAVREMYKNPEIFSSESITPWEPDPLYRFVPTQVDAPEHIKYRRIVNPLVLAAARSTRSRDDQAHVCRRLRRRPRPEGRVRLRRGRSRCASRPRCS